MLSIVTNSGQVQCQGITALTDTCKSRQFVMD